MFNVTDRQFAIAAGTLILVNFVLLLFVLSGTREVAFMIYGNMFFIWNGGLLIYLFRRNNEFSQKQVKEIRKYTLFFLVPPTFIFLYGTWGWLEVYYSSWHDWLF